MTRTPVIFVLINPIAMKKLSYYCASLMLLALSCKQADNNPAKPQDALSPEVVNNPATASGTDSKKGVPEFKFEQETWDFGQIQDGEKISFAYQFTNVGDAELVIRAANGSCGCTVPEFPKDPIPPGGKGIINVTFDSNGKTGMQHKTVTIISNTIPNTKVINVTGEVLPK